MFIDPKTAAKMVFISGDMSDGSANDLHMRQLCGNKKTVCLLNAIVNKYECIQDLIGKDYVG